jgi:hypothetical protein
MAEIVTNEYNSRISERLAEFGIDSNVLFEKLIECKAYICGSFILQCVLDERYEKSDIDIFVFEDNFDNLNRCISQLLNLPLNSTNKNPYNLLQFSHVVKYNNTCSIDVVCVNTKSCLDFFNNSFDLSFCKTLFDGRMVTITQDTLNKVGFVINFKYSSHERIQKYRSRGFRILNYQTPEEKELIKSRCVSTVKLEKENVISRIMNFFR